MPEQWEIERAIKILRICQWLLAKADDRGKTHGEKHHFHEVLGATLREAIEVLEPGATSMERNISTEDVSDIPF